MNKFKKTAAGVLTFAMIASVTVTAGAATEHWNDASGNGSAAWEQWKEEWESVKTDYEQVSLTPGSDETRLNFAWYSKTAETPAVRIARTSGMTSFTEFKGTQKVIAEENALGYYSNKVTISGLTENTEYFYTVFKNGEWSKPAAYSTKGFTEYSVLYVGDPQIGACKGQTSAEGDTMADEIAARNDAFNWNRTLENALSAHKNVSFMLSAGDQVNKAEREYEYAGYLFPAVLDSLPVSTAIGNHDSASYQYSSHFNNPNSFELDDSVYALGHTAAGTDYYYTYGSVLYIVIDTNNYNCATHKAVIEKAISENPDAKWRVVMFHQDIYGSGLDHSDSDGIVLRTQLTPVFDENDIDIVLQGHDHAYSRTYQLRGDGKQHAAYNKDNYGDSADFLSENNCYSVLTGAGDGNKVIDPDGTVYIEANSSTGSKFYELIPVQQDYIAERSQTWTPSYAVLEFSETAATITVYDALTNQVLDNTSPYTIIKRADSASLENIVNKAEVKLGDGIKYTDASTQKLTAILAEAKTILDNPESTSVQIAGMQADVANALSELTVYTGDAGKPLPPDDEPDTGVTDSVQVFAVLAVLSFAGLAVIFASEFKKKHSVK